jgi:LmbE family N-acetylglucosaminyl deacetylase
MYGKIDDGRVSSSTRCDIVRVKFVVSCLLSILVICAVGPLGPHARALSNAADGSLAINRGERLLVIAPHPDDETLGAAGLIQRVVAHGGSVRTVVVTAGDGFVEAVQRSTGQRAPRPSAFLSYGQRRIEEANAAAAALSPRGIRVDVLGFPDGGLSPLLSAHWDRVRPGRSPTTGRTAPPYRKVLDRRLAYAGADLRSGLLQVMRQFRPTMVVFTDPDDAHPDHRAVGLFALLATDDWMQSRRKNASWPRMLAFLVHWKQWPPDSGASAVPDHIVDAPLDLPADLPLRDQERTCLSLSDRELGRKQKALDEHKTQTAVLAPFLASFVRRTECFSVNTRRDAQDVDAQIGRPIPRRARPALYARAARAALPQPGEPLQSPVP